MLCSRQPKTNEQASAASVAWISEAQSGNRIIRCGASQMFGFQLGASMPTENNTITSFQRRFASEITVPYLAASGKMSLFKIGRMKTFKPKKC